MRGRARVLKPSSRVTNLEFICICVPQMSPGSISPATGVPSNAIQGSRGPQLFFRQMQALLLAWLLPWTKMLPTSGYTIYGVMNTEAFNEYTLLIETVPGTNVSLESWSPGPWAPGTCGLGVCWVLGGYWKVKPTR